MRHRKGLAHLSDEVLLQDLAALLVHDRENTAVILAHLAEVEVRKLYVPRGYDSLRAYCVHVLHMSEDEAGRRIHVANKTRQVPALLDAIADGRLHLTGASLLAPHITVENAAELLTAATHKTRGEIEYLVACRFPRADVPTLFRPIEPRVIAHVPEQVATGDAVTGHVPEHGAPGDPIAGHVPEHVVVVPAVPPRFKPLSATTYEFRGTFDQELTDLIKQSQELEGLPAGSRSIPDVLKRALRARVAELQKRKFGATDQPRAAKPSTGRNARHIPASVKRAVYQRDGGQCTYFSDDGHRCESRRVEYDHIVPIAKGGESTAENLRLRCRAHNHHAAEQEFGSGFMKEKRESARARRANARAQALERRRAEEREEAAALEKARAERATPEQAHVHLERVRAMLDPTHGPAPAS